MAERASSQSMPTSKVLNYLVAKHVDRMSQNITGFDPMQPNINLITGYYLQIQHFENLITTYTDDKYFEKKEKIGLEKAKNRIRKGFEVKELIEFCEVVAKWYRLVHVYASNNDLITSQKKIPHKENEFEEG